ncbi:MAG: hypothetical protein P8103_05020 [Candidatus Thiodiazotropha sp.]
MSFEIITSPPRYRLLRSFRRKLTQLMGVLLFLGGLAASSLPLLLVIAAAMSILAPSAGFPDLDSEQVAIFLGAAVIAVVGLTLGLKLIRGRRRLVLFLRRFGYDQATKVLSFAATSAMGQRWRLATLDDNEIAPVLGIKTRGRILSVLRWAFLIVILASLFWLFGEGFKDYLGGVVDGMKSEGRGGGFEAIIGQFFSILFMTIIIGVIVGGLVLIGVALLGAGMLFSWRSFRSYKKAELGQSKVIERASEIEPIVQSVLKLSRKILSPRLVVVRVYSGIWQEVVRRFSDVSAVILIDVSIPGEGLLWEVENLKTKYRKQTVFVGQYEALASLSSLTVDSDAADTEQRLATLLDGESVLAYRGEGPPDMKRFSRLLRSKLNDLY